MMPFGEFLVVSSLDYLCVNSGSAVYIVAR